MKIILIILGGVCLAWVVVAVTVPCASSKAKFDGTIKECWAIIGTNDSPDMNYDDHIVSIKLGTLKKLDDLAEQSIMQPWHAQFFLWVSGAGAFFNQ